MPHHPATSLQGRVTDVFAHRFVIETRSGERHLADIGPKGAEAVALRAGDDVTIQGEVHPSEIKVTRLERAGRTIDIPRPPKPAPPGQDKQADSIVALDAVKAAGAAVLGAPMQHPRHFEVLGQKGTSYVEYHVEFDGRIRKEKPVERDDRKWANVIGH